MACHQKAHQYAGASTKFRPSRQINIFMLCAQVCVDETYRRKGVATRMLKAYLLMVQQTLPEVQCLRLICKKDLVPLYTTAGFEMIGPSDVQHGKDPWYEMAFQLPGHC